MSSSPFTIEDQGDGEFLVRAEALDDEITELTIVLSDAGSASDGSLAEDEPTASATMRFLLTHQDPADLPWRVYITDVLAAYPDAAEKIAALRG